LKVIIEADTRKTTRDVSEELNIDLSKVILHLHQTGNSKQARQNGAARTGQK
jgi:hypothetical protein